jgi:hypothetical protein
MSVPDVIVLLAAFSICLYLLYAMVRGERL